MMDKNEEYIYKVVSRKHWQICVEQEELKPVEIDIKDGYLHFSTITQLRETLALYFSDRNDLMLLLIKIKDVEQQLKWEKSRNNALFPHLYGKIDIDLIKHLVPIEVDSEGNANLEELLKC